MKFVTDLSKGILGRPDSEELWNEIISYVPDEMLLKPDFRALVVACGHCTEAILLVKRMQSLGIPNSRIQDAIWVLDKYQVFTNQARCLGFKHVITSDFLSWDAKGMKFNLCLGNPPYKDRNSKNAIYPHFLNVAANHTKPNGIVMMITPRALIQGFVKGRTDGIKIPPVSVKTVSIETSISDAFPGIGSDFCWFVVTLGSKATETIFRTDNGAVVCKSLPKVIPMIVNVLSLSIFSKVFDNGNSIGLSTSDIASGDGFEKMNDGAAIAIRTINADGSLDTYRVTTSHRSYGKSKIFFSMLGKKVFVDRTGVYVPGKEHLMVWVTANESEIASILSAMDTKLYRFFYKMMDSSRMGGADALKSMASFPLDRTWTDAELYSHFNLTQEEIDYIEANVA